MHRKIRSFFHSLFNRGLDFRVRLFNILALGGTAVSFLMAVFSAFTGSWPNFLINLVLMLVSGGLFFYSCKSGRYQLCYIITILLIFFFFFPVMFFTSGGYRGGMSLFFIFAIIFTVLMLENRPAMVISLAELLFYLGLCLFAFFHPDTVTDFSSEAERLTDILSAFLAVGVICGLVLSLHLREYRRQQLLLQEQNLRLQQYDSAKSTFLTTVAHELKNPLNVISLHARDTSELLEETPLDFTQMQANLHTIQESVLRIDRIVLDLMDTVSIEQGRLSLSPVPTDLNTLLQKIQKEYESRPGTRNNRMLLRAADDLPPILADPERLRQVISNLISNAERYTQNGTITLSLTGSSGWQTVCVADTGVGMSDALRQRVLKGYVSADKNYWRHGIGLYVCHQIITAHKGKIWITSQPCQGTRVYFSLPQEEKDGTEKSNHTDR